MSEVDKINEQIAALTAQRESVMLKERANVLAKMKADMKLYGFKTSDFKGVLLTRAKRGPNKAKTVKKAVK
jgi:ribosomal protein L19